MRILIEGHQYKAALVKELLADIQDPFDNNRDPLMINYVGYFYNTKVRDCVFILPKVLLEGEKNTEEKVFGKYEPEEIINLIPNSNNPLSEEEKSFIYGFAVWIYRAVKVFKKYNADSQIVYQQKINQAKKGFRRKTDTFLDIILELLRFNRENQNFFFFILRNLHSGYNKINWTRTISTTSAIVQDNCPIYLNPVNKKRQINFDEELLVIFFSILNYINDYYGFDAQINCNFDLITGNRFKRYIDGLGKTRLLQIKYKYFSDKALELWELCYTFFDHAHLVNSNIKQNEYLVVKNFNIVFEAIIDELIGDSDIPFGLKEQEDGKRIDHLYTYRELTSYLEDQKIYYIGDSKYYKSSTKIQGSAFYKQFTYARNVIQWHLNLFGSEENENKEEKEKYKDVVLRDNITEGYNIIPNFFISAKINKKKGSNEMSFDYSNDSLKMDDKWDEKNNMQVHFENRIFDRDTLILFHYNVNFLFVLSLYARNNTLQKDDWKKMVRRKFREEIQKELNEKFNFYAMQALPGVDAESYIKENFHEVLGKVYTPYADNNVFSLALEKDEKYQTENDTLLSALRNYFEIVECRLGENPSSKLTKIPAEVRFSIGASTLRIKASSRVLIGLVADDNPYKDKFLSSTATLYYTGPNFPTTIALNNLHFFIPFIKKHGIRDLYEIIKVRTIKSSEVKGKKDNSTKKEIRLAFELKFSHRLFPDYQRINLKKFINYTFWDTRFDEQDEWFNFPN